MRSQQRRFISWGVAALFSVLLAVVLFRVEWVVAILAWLSPAVIYSADTQEPLVALTIDDGPDAVVTASILDRLDQHGAHATFFLLSSRVPGNESLVERMVDEGHELANHLVDDTVSVHLTPADFEGQLITSHEVLSKFSDIRWFRPGSGWYDRTMLATLRAHNYRCALGSVYPFDPQIPWPWFSARYILWNVQPGSVIVLHDYGSRGERTGAVLDTILPELDRRGFRVVTLSELLAE